ncbi:hypothetical protein [Pseudomonas juntendi]|uniref:hypothetical protein n=1 Tax=Pseudomonas juntendi TaxID=2666183 RepID=UPI0018D8AA34|nr:hypothetical protein [Pseudomonas juntendi]MBH3373125.1 hypothetical protein [Pseudomonas juntendi]
MLFGTGIKLKGVTFNNPALPKLANYQDLIANHANCVGAWRFDKPELLTLDSSGGLLRIQSWRIGGKDLVLSEGTSARIQQSAITGGNVAVFSSAGEYLLATDQLNLGAGYTLAAVFKPDSYASPCSIVGTLNTADLTKTGALMSRNGTSATPAVAFYEGSKTHYANVPDATGMVGAIVRHSANALVNGAVALMGKETIASSAGDATGSIPLKVGSASQYPFLGQLDFVAVFNIDVGSDPKLSADLQSYLRLRAHISR